MTRGDLTINGNLEERSLQFSEAESSWRRIPRWTDFLIKFGYILGDPAWTGRRIWLVSMPCESAAAGLAALGAMCRRLTVDGANDSSSHYQRIERLARNNIESYLRNNKQKGRFRLEGAKDHQGVIWVRSVTADSSRRFVNQNRRRFGILPSNACDWYFDGEAPVQAIEAAELSHGEFYGKLVVAGAPVVRSNFRRSDSGICLAGRVAGESVSKALYAAIRFQNHGCVVSLPELLTIQHRLPGMISRVTFFNTRTGQLDRNTGLTRLVIADGDAAFLKVLQIAQFKSCDVLGVVHRVVDRERLESVGVKIAELAQWYATDAEMQHSLPPAPSGIAILALKRR